MLAYGSRLGSHRLGAFNRRARIPLRCLETGGARVTDTSWPRYLSALQQGACKFANIKRTRGSINGRPSVRACPAYFCVRCLCILSSAEFFPTWPQILYQTTTLLITYYQPTSMGLPACLSGLVRCCHNGLAALFFLVDSPAFSLDHAGTTLLTRKK